MIDNLALYVFEILRNEEAEYVFIAAWYYLVMQAWQMGIPVALNWK